ncbi:MAG: hypothetical protein KBD27_02670 [Candidatus Moranbacteria bacterium]|nr:hypothetical protein [Candidatus Moranbacteria bacterium]
MIENHDDFVLAEALIQAGLLQEIRGDQLKEKAPNGAVLITCGDRDRFKAHFTGCNGFVDVHPICLNGGGVLLGKDIDVVRQRVIVEDCVEAFAVKSLSFVLTLSHFPCGKCTKLGIGLREIALKTLEGKIHLKQHIPKDSLKGVLPLISIDWRNAHIKQEHGVKLYAMRRQDATAIAGFGRTDDDLATMRPFDMRHHPPHFQVFP